MVCALPMGGLWDTMERILGSGCIARSENARSKSADNLDSLQYDIKCMSMDNGGKMMDARRRKLLRHREDGLQPGMNNIDYFRTSYGSLAKRTVGYT